MKVFVIPDIHLKPWIFDKAAALLKAGRAEQAVCLMDIADDWNMEFQLEKYKTTYDRAIKFAKDYPNTLWCYGNHDLSYLWGQRETGYSVYAENIVISKVRELEYAVRESDQMAMMHRIDQVLFSHGGLSLDYVSWLDESLVDADIDDVLYEINNASPTELWMDASPLWFRPQYRPGEGFRQDEYVQVVGHTPVEAIYEQEGFISTDVFSTYRDGTQIGESAFLVIETETGKYERVWE